jgi:voltage-gated potassium channel Kch
LFALGAIFKLPTSQNFLFAFALAEGGEFAFVLFSFAIQHHVLSPDIANPLVVAVALSMAVAPLLMIVNDKLVQPRFAASGMSQKADVIDEKNEVIIAGFGRFGNVVGRFLKAQGITTTVLDLDPEQIEALRHFGIKVFYGDAGRLDLLHSAKADQAKVLLLAIDEPEKANIIAVELKRHFPHLKVLARAESLQHAYELMHIGVAQVFRETYDSALSMGFETMKTLGFRAYEAHRAVKQFRQYEQQSMAHMFAVREDQKMYAEKVREKISELEDLMQRDAHNYGEHVDQAWEKSKRPDAG